MSGLLLDAQATVLCAHAGQALPIVPSTRVQLGGQPAVMLPVPYTVAGCALPPVAGGPCVTAQWIMGATRVLIEGSPALLTDSMSVCVPTGTPLSPVVTQLRVQGSLAMHLDYPFHVSSGGRSAGTDDDDHIYDLVEQVLFTAPGERVNRPTFGSGILRLVFEPAGAEVAAATQFLVQSALQQWLADVVEVQAVQVDSQDSTLTVAVRYRARTSADSRTAVFVRPV